MASYNMLVWLIVGAFAILQTTSVAGEYIYNKWKNQDSNIVNCKSKQSYNESDITYTISSSEESNAETAEKKNIGIPNNDTSCTKPKQQHIHTIGGIAYCLFNRPPPVA